MNVHRRRFLNVVTGAVALPAIVRRAWALNYPTRPVRLIVAFPAGGSSDIVARLLGQRLSDQLGQPFIIDNRPGAGGNIGTEVVTRAPPDGYTLLLASNANAVNATLYEKVNFNFISDITSVAGIVRWPNILELNPAVPAKSVPEFIAYAKANPGKINMASGGNGTSQHVAGELFKMMTGVDMVHVPYRGSGPALADLLAGQVQVMFDPIATSIEYIRAGKLRGLAVTSAGRVEALADLPTVSDYVPGYEASSWHGIGAPKNTPAEITENLNKETNIALADPRVAERLGDLGGVLLSGSPANFSKFIADETEKWGKVVKFAGIKAE